MIYDEVIMEQVIFKEKTSQNFVEIYTQHSVSVSKPFEKNLYERKNSKFTETFVNKLHSHFYTIFISL